MLVSFEELYVLVNSGDHRFVNLDHNASLYAATQVRIF